MSTNEEILELIQREILVKELIEQTKAGGLIWSQFSPTEYRVTEIDRSQCVDPFYGNTTWEAIITKTYLGSELVYNLDLSKNGYKEVGMKSDQITAITDLYNTVERNILEPRKNLTKAIQFYQQLDNVHNAVDGPPFVLRPNSDLDFDWLRVPANGYGYSKISQPVDDHDGDSTYIYDTTISTAKFGFDPLPDFAPDTYTSVTLRMAVKNISSTQLIGAIMLVEGINVTTDTNVVLENLTVGSYVVVESTWTRSFSKEEINNLKVQLGAMAPVNRVSAMEIVVT